MSQDPLTEPQKFLDSHLTEPEFQGVQPLSNREDSCFGDFAMKTIPAISTMLLLAGVAGILPVSADAQRVLHDRGITLDLTDFGGHGYEELGEILHQTAKLHIQNRHGITLWDIFVETENSIGGAGLEYRTDCDREPVMSADSNDYACNIDLTWKLEVPGQTLDALLVVDFSDREKGDPAQVHQVKSYILGEMELPLGRPRSSGLKGTGKVD